MCKFDLSKPYCFYFNEIAKIPHGSFDEEKIADYVYNFGLESGLETIRDEYNNIIIYKEASLGSITAPTKQTNKFVLFLILLANSTL